MEDRIPDHELLSFSDFVTEAMGLDFPPTRWPDLRRGIAATTKELGFNDAKACIHWLMSAPRTAKQLEILASHLTVGETYFFRESKTLDIFVNEILPPLIRARQGHDRRLRIWSAACCTGEEAYSIAILLREAIPDLDSWNVTLLATDINPNFLRKAGTGIYGAWSFRETPSWLKQRYFHPTDNGQFEISPQIKRMVRFAYLNLVEDVYPSLANETNALDVIFCRNVLMYFTAAQAAKVIQKLHRAQMEGGWLMVSACELPQLSSAPYATVKFPEAILYRKVSSASSAAQTTPAPTRFFSAKTDQAAPFAETLTRVSPAIATEQPVARAPDLYAEALDFYQEGFYAEAIEKLAQLPCHRQCDPVVLSLCARSLANQGKLDEALECCDRWIAVDKMNGAGHYLRASILQEQSQIDEAKKSFRSALYLDPGFVLAHFALGSIARRRGDVRESEKHIENAARLLESCEPDDVVPESEGITVGRFREILNTLRNQEAAT